MIKHYFRPIKSQDKKAIFNIMKVKEVNEFLPWEYFKRLNQVNIKKLKCQKCEVLIFQHKLIGYFLMREYHHFYDVSYFLLPKFWKKGFGKILLKRIIAKIKKEDENWKGIEGLIHPLNFASKKLLINSGFHFVGFFESWYVYRLKNN